MNVEAQKVIEELQRQIGQYALENASLKVYVRELESERSVSRRKEKE